MGKLSYWVILSLLLLTILLAGCQSGETTSTTPSSTPTANAPKIPHGLEGMADCLSCHATGTHGVPADHAGRVNSGCTACHKSAN
jgi:hypothetical protein